MRGLVLFRWLHCWKLLTRPVRENLRDRAISLPGPWWSIDGRIYAIGELLGPKLLPVQLEAILAKNPAASLLYAKGVLHGPFPPGEPAIATNGGWAYLYAKQVVHRRFPPGEQAILLDRDYRHSYWELFCREECPTYRGWAQSVRAAAKDNSPTSNSKRL